jgi:hypothetical protein
VIVPSDLRPHYDVAAQEWELYLHSCGENLRALWQAEAAQYAAKRNYWGVLEVEIDIESEAAWAYDYGFGSYHSPWPVLGKTPDDPTDPPTDPTNIDAPVEIPTNPNGVSTWAAQEQRSIEDNAA